MQKRLAPAVLTIALTACTNTGDPVCGEGADPVIVTGLNGYLDEITPAVEVQLRVPETCEVLDTLWMVWDAEAESVTLVETPDAEKIERRDVEVDDLLLYFTRENLAVRLVYPEEGVQARELQLVWYTPPDAEHAVFDCAAPANALECTVREP